MLPASWVDHARTRRSEPPDDDHDHGAHWWLRRDDLGTFAALGYEGQHLYLVPALDLIVVSLAKIPTEHRATQRAILGGIVDAMRERA